ncbi:MAG TPA: ABC transporter ATP-binding protein [Candidimonas sp.]|nr:ABC transporter ATP-binding protein [Candidimonas sp.]
MASIVVDSVNKFFGTRQVLHDLSFRVAPGEIVGLLGPNGSGKTTTLRLIAGYYQADSGVLEVQGMRRQGAGGRSHAYVGYLPERAPLYDSLTVLQFLRFVASCKGLKGKRLSSSVDASLQAFDLASVAKTAIGRLSKGFRQRVGLGQAILGDPAVLLLDEATNGLDPMQIIEAREMIRRAAAGRAVVFSSHLMQEVQALCTRAIVLRRGRLITDIPLNSRTNPRSAIVLLHWEGVAIAPLTEAIKALDGVLQVDATAPAAPNQAYALRVRFASHPRSLNALLACALAWGHVRDVFFESENVEDILVKAVRESDRQSALPEHAT